MDRSKGFRARQLGRALRKLRERAGLTQAEIGRHLRFSEAEISRIEHGQLPEYNGLKAMLDRYGLTVDQWQPYLDMLFRAEEKGWWHGFGLDDTGYVSMENDASLLRNFEFGYIPGLLQTEAYMRTIFESVRVPRSRRWIDRQVAVRLRRQQRLFEDPPLELHAIIDETALRTEFDRALMRDQLLHIVQLAELSNVTMQIVPRSIGSYDGPTGSFVLVSFPDPDEPDVGHAEHAFGAVYLYEASQVRDCRLTFEHYSALALNHDDSVAMLKRMAAEP